ncbi:hypothetical protein CEN45_00930 [Fischerella thermalis CCMEE 5198]|nr:hypothetical protein CI594_00675 [Fischerella thermalis CCMEE 5196]PMB27634.1 hypothetical protein CEN45_00930 [Fischerella thermalis CCMEE 5198]
MTIKEIILSWQKSGQKFVVFVFLPKIFLAKLNFPRGRWGLGAIMGRCEGYEECKECVEA